MNDRTEGSMTVDVEAAIQQLREEQIRVDAARPTDGPPCPDWCRHAEDYPTLVHGYDSAVDPWDEPITFMRFHTLDIGPGVHVSQEEFTRGGAVSFGPAHVFMADAGDCEEMTSAQARARAEVLVAAADRLDEIAGVQLTAN
ncbi:MAG: hypothetical protein M3O28_12810 [Actinomycetota bacterium]|nr:hypothetical protein [Actinomycetota bacterium]